MSQARVIVVGTSFAGYTGAIELRSLLGDDAEILVISPSSEFLFIPSLIWVPFGLRKKEDITFDVRSIYQKKGIEFVQASAQSFDLDRNLVLTDKGEFVYDYLLVATGPKTDFEYIPGLSPDKFSHSICTYDHAVHTGQAWHEFLKAPGPIVVGAVQGAACFGAAYEFVLNLRYQLKKNNVLDRAPLMFVSAEPFLAHFGIGGFGNAEQMCQKLFEHYGIQWRLNAVVDEVTADGVQLQSGEFLPSKFTMLIPRFLGVDAVRNTQGLANSAGFIETNDYYQHLKHPNVFAAGVAAHVAPPAATKVPCGVPKTGYPSEQMAKTAAHNIAALLRGSQDLRALPYGDIKALCIMDTGNMGMMIVGDHMLSPRAHEAIIPGPQAHWAKLGFEKYFLESRRHGIV